MVFIHNINANVSKLLVCLIVLFFINSYTNAQEDEEKKIAGPIGEKLEEQKSKDYLGSKLNAQEEEELTRIHKKYQYKDKEIAARSKHRSGQPLTLMDNYRLARANRKDYMRNKKLAEFRRNKVLSRQSPEMRQRMLENEKKIKARDKKKNRTKKRKRFFNLFR